MQTASALNWPFPVSPEIRFAQLDDDGPTFGMHRAFRPESATDLEGYRPNVISGSVMALRRLAEQAELGTVDLTGLDHAVIAITRCGHEPLGDVLRVVFWQAFGVPVYEVFTGLDNSILGYECELHEGWHLTSQVRLAEVRGQLVLDAAGVSGLQTSLTGLITRDECPCGRPGIRLLNVQAAPVIQRLGQRMKAAVSG